MATCEYCFRSINPTGVSNVVKASRRCKKCRAMFHDECGTACTVCCCTGFDLLKDVRTSGLHTRERRPVSRLLRIAQAAPLPVRKEAVKSKTPTSSKEILQRILLTFWFSCVFLLTPFLLDLANQYPSISKNVSCLLLPLCLIVIIWITLGSKSVLSKLLLFISAVISFLFVEQAGIIKLSLFEEDSYFLWICVAYMLIWAVVLRCSRCALISLEKSPDKSIESHTASRWKQSLLQFFMFTVSYLALYQAFRIFGSEKTITPLSVLEKSEFVGLISAFLYTLVVTTIAFRILADLAVLRLLFFFIALGVVGVTGWWVIVFQKFDRAIVWFLENRDATNALDFWNRVAENAPIIFESNGQRFALWYVLGWITFVIFFTWRWIGYKIVAMDEPSRK
jgi:hypothetical protein